MSDDFSGMEFPKGWRESRYYLVTKVWGHEKQIKRMRKELLIIKLIIAIMIVAAVAAGTPVGSFLLSLARHLFGKTL